MANKSFWVVFRHGPDRKKESMAMAGPSPRHIAAEIRRKYRDADIEAIRDNSHRGANACRGNHEQAHSKPCQLP